MAKKKTENIKAAPVLRAHGDEQPTPTPEQTGTRTYQIMDPWKDRDVVNLVDVKAVDGEITEVKVNGEPAGGGGGGDFSTAQVTIDNSNNKGSYPPIYGSIIDSYNQGGIPPTLIDCTGGEIAPSDSIQTYTVILYKGKAKVSVRGLGGETITISGNVTDLGDTNYLFSGDGTLTIS